MNGQPHQRQAVAHVRAVVRRAGTSFYWAMKLLPRSKRQAMFAIYAFAREVDDIADRPGPPEEKLGRLVEWAEEIEALYAGRPRRLVGRALAAPVARYGLTKAHFLDVLRGVEMDVRAPLRAPSMAELERYCARVAGAVGLLSVEVFECRDARARDFALATGHALQLTNILRDLAEDAGNGRLYVPRELLDAAGVDGLAPEAAFRHPGFPRACGALAETAAGRFAEAGSYLAAMPRAAARSLRPAVIMMAVYRTLFDRLAARGWTRLDLPVRLGAAERLGIALRYGVFGP